MKREKLTVDIMNVATLEIILLNGTLGSGSKAPTEPNCETFFNSHGPFRT